MPHIWIKKTPPPVWERVWSDDGIKHTHAPDDAARITYNQYGRLKCVIGSSDEAMYADKIDFYKEIIEKMQSLPKSIEEYNNQI